MFFFCGPGRLFLAARDGGQAPQTKRVSSFRDKEHSKYSISAKSILSELQVDINKIDSYLPEGLTSFLRPVGRRKKSIVCVRPCGSVAN